jgi:hypothetical protein
MVQPAAAEHRRRRRRTRTLEHLERMQNGRWAWANYCNGDLDQAERWLNETTSLAPPADQWIVGVAAIADLSLIAGLRGRRSEQIPL